MSEWVKAAESAKRQQQHNLTMGVVVTDMNVLAKKLADEKERKRQEREARRQAAERARREDYQRRLANAREQAEADYQQWWDDHVQDLENARQEVWAAQDELFDAHRQAIDAEYAVRGVFDDLNDLRIAQDFTQDVAGVVIGGAGFVFTGGTSFVILTTLGAANNLARPDLVGAAQDTFNSGVAELATRTGYKAGADTVSAFALGKDLLEFTDPADLYGFDFSNLANPEDIQGIRELFAKDPRGIAEKLFGPEVNEVDGKLADWQKALKNRDEKAEKLERAKRKLAKLSGKTHDWGVLVNRRMTELMGGY